MYTYSYAEAQGLHPFLESTIRFEDTASFEDTANS